ncbi:MAG: aromatic ring-hydroxylating dioxygenase subunit alpha [Planctomycetota bacterium]
MAKEAKEKNEGFDPGVPVAEAHTPPSAWYTDPDFLEKEKAAVFLRTWQAVGRTDQVRKKGDFFTGTLLGEPYLVVCEEPGRLRAFSNVCRHHAAPVARGEGRLERLVCPYHGWTYNLSGRLTRAPRMAGVKHFDRERFSLPELQVTTWGPLVLVIFDRTAKPSSEGLEELEGRLEESGTFHLPFAARRTFELACNWKVFVENYLDGGYHVAGLHPGLAAQLDLASYRTEVGERFVIQSCRAGGRGAAPRMEEAEAGDFQERVGGGALYAWIHPNLMLNRYGPILDTNRVFPLAPGRCRVVFDWFVAPEATAGDARFLERSLRASEKVQEEDTWICAAVQEGLASGSYDRGRYAPALEHGMHHFHRLLARDLQGNP